MLADTKVRTIFDRQGDAHALVDTLADTLEEVEAVRHGNTGTDPHTLIDTLTDMLADVEQLKIFE